jgi:hypothetical protein
MPYESMQSYVFLLEYQQKILPHLQGRTKWLGVNA